MSLFNVTKHTRVYMIAGVNLDGTKESLRFILFASNKDRKLIQKVNVYDLTRVAIIIINIIIVIPIVSIIIIIVSLYGQKVEGAKLS